MDCAKDANLNIVRDEFKNSTIQMKNGKIVKMDSPEAMNVIVLPLITGDNIEMTMKFVDQLALQEGVAKMIIKSAKIDKVRKLFVRIDNIFSAVSKQKVIIQSEFDKFGNIDNDPDYLQKLEDLKYSTIS